MAKYHLSSRALEDLSEIWEYTYEAWSEVQADKYYFLLLDTCQSLADGTLAGKPYLEIAKDIFGFKIGRHLVFYKKAKGTGVEIVRILHEQMDLKALTKFRGYD
ncbi:MAG: type II toxin-antitoxin system RelE/ParE family toxin [Bacteroidetes bacterium]|nr:type II toxin-antitoxin system RelE/ParE family toxin [Bacteroidota bacterium]